MAAAAAIAEPHIRARSIGRVWLSHAAAPRAWSPFPTSRRNTGQIHHHTAAVGLAVPIAAPHHMTTAALHPSCHLDPSSAPSHPRRPPLPTVSSACSHRADPSGALRWRAPIQRMAVLHASTAAPVTSSAGSRSGSQ